MRKKLFSGEVSHSTDDMRCRRSDGRQWRCPQQAISGLSFCEHHYQQVRRNQDNIKTANMADAAAAGPERRMVFKADPPPSKKRRPMRIRKDPCAAEPIFSEKMEKGDVKRVSSDLKWNRDLHMPVKFRHQQSDGREWQCSQPSMPVLNFCDRRHLRCKRPKEENNKVILKPKLKWSPCPSADMTPSIKLRQRRRRLNGETGTEVLMKMSEPEGGACDMETAEPAVTGGLPIPNTLRCRRSDGKKWRCSHPAIFGLRYCDYHQMRCKQASSKNTRVKAAISELGSQFSVDLRHSTKRSQRRRMGEQQAEDLMRMERIDEGLKAAELTAPELNLFDKDLLSCNEDNSKTEETVQREEEVEATEPSSQDETETVEPATPGLNVCDHDQQCCEESNNRNKEAAAKHNSLSHFVGDPQPSMKDLSLPDHLRCRRSDGRKWRCPQMSMPSVGFCEYHYFQVRRNQGKRKKTKSDSGTKRKRALCLAAKQSLARKLRGQQLRGEVAGEERIRTAQKEERDEGLEVTRDLPNGVMAISPAPLMVQANASPWLHWKIGLDDGYLLFGRRFRSKNAELVQLGKVEEECGRSLKEGLSWLQGQGK